MEPDGFFVGMLTILDSYEYVYVASDRIMAVGAVHGSTFAPLRSASYHHGS